MFKWLKLLRWLGPWCNQERAPKISHHDEEVDFGTNKFRCRVYRPSRLSGAVVVLPGLHPDGLDDARLDRFCRVLAGANILVGLPELPTMQASVMQSDLIEETKLALQYFQQRFQIEGIQSVGLFCISASSIAGLTVTNDDEISSFIHRLHLFGGFADWNEALRFSMTGEISHLDGATEYVSIDPLGLPVVYMNLQQSFPTFLPFSIDIQAQLMDAWHQFVSETWEKPSVRHPQDTSRIAKNIASTFNISDATLQDRVEAVFLQGCAITEGGQDRVHQFLNALDSENLLTTVQWLNPKPQIEKIVIPLDISHGTEDFVVPYPQAIHLQRWSMNQSARVFVTGLYHHTGTVDFKHLLRMLTALPKEIWTSIQLVRAIADLARRPEAFGATLKNNR